MDIEGPLNPRFAPIRDALAASIDRGDDLGAGVCAIVDGDVVADLRGGFRDRKRETPFGDPLLCVYSCGKAVTGAVIMAAVEAGQLDYDAPVASVWPEFGAHGKDRVTLAEALSHQAGLSGFLKEIDPTMWIDWARMTEALAAMEPIYPPGSASGYHAQTVGFIAGEVLRRQTGKTVGAALREYGLEVYCGLTADEMAQTAPMKKPPSAPDLGRLTPLKKAVFLEKWSAPRNIDREAWMAAEIPSANIHATARGMAEVMQAFATGQINGKPVASDAVREAALRERISGQDLVLPFELSWASGVMRNRDGQLGPGAEAVGHYGFGGACVIADPTHRLSFAYVPNKMSPALIADPRAIGLLEALYACF